MRRRVGRVGGGTGQGGSTDNGGGTGRGRCTRERRREGAVVGIIWSGVVLLVGVEDWVMHHRRARRCVVALIVCSGVFIRLVQVGRLVGVAGRGVRRERRMRMMMGWRTL